MRDKKNTKKIFETSRLSQKQKKKQWKWKYTQKRNRQKRSILSNSAISPFYGFVLYLALPLCLYYWEYCECHMKCMCLYDIPLTASDFLFYGGITRVNDLYQNNTEYGGQDCGDKIIQNGSAAHLAARL